MKKRTEKHSEQENSSTPYEAQTDGHEQDAMPVQDEGTVEEAQQFAVTQEEYNN
jgi:hypothetical protein